MPSPKDGVTEANPKLVVVYTPYSGIDPQQLEAFASVYGWEIQWPDKSKEQPREMDYLLAFSILTIFLAGLLLASGIHYYIDTRDKFYHSVIRILFPVVIAAWLMTVILTRA